MNRYSTLIAAVGVMALIGAIVVPLSTQAGPADSYFILGEWTYENEDEWGTSTITINFKMGGEGTMLFEYEGEGESESDESSFEWKIEDDKLFMKFEDDTDYDEGTEYEFGSFYTTLKAGDSDDEYKKTGSVCGVCCPFPFMVIGIPALAGLVAVRAYKKRN